MRCAKPAPTPHEGLILELLDPAEQRCPIRPGTGDGQLRFDVLAIVTKGVTVVASQHVVFRLTEQSAAAVKPVPSVKPQRMPPRCAAAGIRGLAAGQVLAVECWD